MDGIGTELARNPPHSGDRNRIQDAQMAPCDRWNRCSDPSDPDTGVAGTTDSTSRLPVRTPAGRNHTNLMASSRKTISDKRGNLSCPTSVHRRIGIGKNKYLHVGEPL